jgi:cobalamin biosynthesis Mg chelatase CobN
MYVELKGEHHTAKALENIADTVKNLTYDKQLRVLVQDYEKYAWMNERSVYHPQVIIRTLRRFIQWVSRNYWCRDPHQMRKERREALERQRQY